MSGQHIAEKENFERKIREEQMVKDAKMAENVQKYELSKVELETELKNVKFVLNEHDQRR